MEVAWEKTHGLKFQLMFKELGRKLPGTKFGFG